MLVDGYDIVLDLNKSEPGIIYDCHHNKRYLDFFTFFASAPLGVNHPKLVSDARFRQKIMRAAINKPSNSDIYTVEMAESVELMSRLAMRAELPYLFFICGGALAVENALKTAFDWKARKNRQFGKEANVLKVVHLEQAFHGRSGYTLSLTNTDPVKTEFFPKFDWPRVINPAMRFPQDKQAILDVELLEKRSIDAIKNIILKAPEEIAAIILEPIQGEGGDNHFRRSYFEALRQVCDESDVMLIFDEVQTGVGATGKMWAWEHFVAPDILAFGKRMQVSGIMAGTRLDEVDGHVFETSSRINSTWGGALVDMVRCGKILQIIEEDCLLDNASEAGLFLLRQLESLAEDYPDIISNPRGRGLMCAFDLPNPDISRQFLAMVMERNLLVLGCGSRSVRFRPPLCVTYEAIDEAMHIIRSVLASFGKSWKFQ